MLWSLWIIYTVFYLLKKVLIKNKHMFSVLKNLFSSWFIFRDNCAYSIPNSKIIEKGTRLNLEWAPFCVDTPVIGETKTFLETRHKEHMAEVKHRRFDRSALTRHVFDLDHSLDWQQSKVLEFDCDFQKCHFIESYYINTDRSSMNDKSSDPTNSQIYTPFW